MSLPRPSLDGLRPACGQPAAIGTDWYGAYACSCARRGGPARSGGARNGPRAHRQVAAGADEGQVSRADHLAVPGTRQLDRTLGHRKDFHRHPQRSRRWVPRRHAAPPRPPGKGRILRVCSCAPSEAFYKKSRSGGLVFQCDRPIMAPHESLFIATRH